MIGQKADGFPWHFAKEDLLELCLQLIQHFLPQLLLEVLLFIIEPLLLDNNRLVRLEHELFPFGGCSNPDHVNILLLFLGQFVKSFICGAQLFFKLYFVGHESLDLVVLFPEFLVDGNIFLAGRAELVLSFL